MEGMVHRVISIRAKEVLYSLGLLPLLIVVLFFVMKAYLLGVSQANAGILLNQTVQIAQANSAYHKAEGVYADSMDKLVNYGFLIKAPSPGNIAASTYELDANTGLFFLVGVTSETCLRTEEIAKSNERLIVNCLAPPRPDLFGMALLFQPKLEFAL